MRRSLRNSGGDPATDQRGVSRVGTADIAAFESRGFNVTVVNGDSQSTPVSMAFALPLVVTVASVYDEPVVGGQVTFTTPLSGASAIFVSSPATIAVGGQASATTTANANAGSYTVTAGGAGIVSPAIFTLNNTEAASLVVTTATDIVDPLDGVTSLREAMSYANSQPGHDTIAFRIGGGGLQTIQPLSPLPVITDPVIIDGSTQSGYAGRPIIEIDGSLAGVSAHGLWITAGDSTVRGLIINRFGGNGIIVVTQGNNVIEDNFIGTDATGAQDQGNVAYGVYIASQSNQILRNVISGNDVDGVLIDGGVALASNNVVAGNFIGTNVDGNAKLGNGTSGAWPAAGVQIGGPLAKSNRIGTDGDGSGDAVERNVISGNVGMGVLIAWDASENLVAGNYIGTDAAGDTTLGNGYHGVLVGYGAEFNVIEGNLVSGNVSFGVQLSSDNNTLEGNYIGTDATGLLPLGNGVPGQWLSAGVALFLNSLNVEDEVTANQIGGSAALANTIAFNAGPGVALWGEASGNAIGSNSIYSNAGLGIDLSFHGVTPDDSGDADSGPNNLQNFPVVTVAEAMVGGTRVAGALDSLPDTTFRLDIYAGSTADPSGYGEGERWLHAISVTTDASGHADFDALLTTVITSGNVITATATENGNTSEFSAAKRVNTRPIADGGGPYTIVEGTPLTLNTSLSHDPDLVAGDCIVKYEWDLDQDGTYEVGTTQNMFIVPWAALVAAGFADGPAQTPIGLRVSDREGANDTQTVQLNIENAAPAANITGPTNGVPGQSRTFILEARDPSPVDQAAGFTFDIDWDGDHIVDQTVSGATDQEVSHIFTSTGMFDVHITATDKDGGTSEVISYSVPITAMAAQGDDLAVGGTTGDDTIAINPSTGGVEVFVALVSQGVFPVVGQVLVFGSDGYDVLRINGTAAADVIFKTPGYVGWGTPSPEAVTLEDFESTPLQQRVTYIGMERTLISGGGGDDGIFDPSDVDTEIHGDAGNDTIVVDGASGNVVVDGGDGSDAVIVSCGSLHGAVDVGDSGTTPGETNSLTVKGASANNTFAVTSDAVAWGSTETISYSPSITSLSVKTGTGTNSVQIDSTSAAGVKIAAQGGTDTYTVQLGSLAGPVSVANDSTGSVSVTIVGTDAADAMTLSGTGVQTASDEVILLNTPVASLTVDGGAGDDQITINNLESPIGQLALNGGDGSDTFTIVNLGDSFVESLTVEGGGTGTGNDQVVIEGELPPGVERELQHVAPLVSALAGPSSGVRGQKLAYAGSFTDSDENFWTATVDYGDGTGSQTLLLNPDKSFQLGYVYSRSGDYTVAVTVDDHDGGMSSRSFSVAVRAVDVQQDPNDPTKAILAIGGTNDDDTILISGATTYDANDLALWAILDEWTSTRSYAQRTANLLETGTGSDFADRLNGSYFLQPDVTVYDDNAKDTLTGCAGRDWFFANVAIDGDDYATGKDKITDLSASEFALDLDFINSAL